MLFHISMFFNEKNIMCGGDSERDSVCSGECEMVIGDSACSGRGCDGGRVIM